MARITELGPEERQEIQTIIDDLVGDRPTISVTAVMRQVVSEVSRQEEEGAWWAGPALRHLAADGIRSLVKSRLEEDRSTITVAKTGRQVSVPARIGARQRKADGTAGQIWEQSLWWEIEWGIIDEVMDERASRRDGLSLEISAWQEVKRLQNRFPAARTPGEACEMAGIDPRKFAIQ